MHCERAELIPSCGPSGPVSSTSGSMRGRRSTVSWTSLDMIDYALNNGAPPPGDPLVGFFDECQDFTPLELALVRHWGSTMERVVLGFDDDQAIYGFKGADPLALIDPPVPEEDKRILRQSYRLPRAVHAVAEDWVRRLSRREPKEYLPRDADGDVRYEPHTYLEPTSLVQAAAWDADAGHTVMILATCAYWLDPIKQALRREGLAYHNPWRRSRGDWNPLRPSRGVSAASRVVAYLFPDERLFGAASRQGTGGVIKLWSALVKSKGVFRRGGRGAVDGLPDRELSFEEVARLFDDDIDLERALQKAQPELAGGKHAGPRAPGHGVPRGHCSAAGGGHPAGRAPGGHRDHPQHQGRGGGLRLSPARSVPGGEAGVERRSTPGPSRALDVRGNDSCSRSTRRVCAVRSTTPSQEHLLKGVL